jgi:hypothetical protein
MVCPLASTTSVMGTTTGVMSVHLLCEEEMQEKSNRREIRKAI